MEYRVTVTALNGVSSQVHSLKAYSSLSVILRHNHTTEETTSPDPTAATSEMVGVAGTSSTTVVTVIVVLFILLFITVLAFIL